MATARPLVSALFLGRMSYKRALEVQNKYARQHLDFLAGKTQETPKDKLLLVEHNPVYTIGIRDRSYTPEDEARLKGLGADFFRTNRGGLITFHGPGQLVAYPILNLGNFTKSMRWYICRLEKSVIRMCAGFGIEACTTSDTGVWVKDRKITAIGVHGSRFVTTHGIAINCDVDLGWFEHIVPCGIEGKGVTSLSQELGRDISIDQVTEPYLQAFRDEFNCDVEWES